MRDTPAARLGATLVGMVVEVSMKGGHEDDFEQISELLAAWLRLLHQPEYHGLLPCAKCGSYDTISRLDEQNSVTWCEHGHITIELEE